MDIREVIKTIILSYSNSFHIPLNTSLPHIINLLHTNKKEKEETVKELYHQFTRYGRQSIILISLSTSSKLFQFILKHTPQICFWKNRVYVGKKRVDLLVLTFSDIRLTF